MITYLVSFVLAFILGTSLAHKQRRLEVPTFWGTTECKMYPYFLLQDYNPQSGSAYLMTYGLQEMNPPADLTIVGLYYADSEESQQQIVKQDELTDYLERKGYIVHSVGLNNYAPKACADSYCPFSTWFYWFKNPCANYIGGCAPDDERLKVHNWQQLLTNVTELPVFQDSEWEYIWDLFGGGENDIFIYDKDGRLYKYICSSLTCGDSSEGNMLTENGYKFVRDTAVNAVKKYDANRCFNVTDDDNVNEDGTWSVHNYYYYYNYYYGSSYYNDDGSSSSGAGDDVYYSYYSSNVVFSTKDIIDDNSKEVISRGRHRIPAFVFASILAIAFIIISGGYIYFKYWRKLNSLDADLEEFEPLNMQSNNNDYGNEHSNNDYNYNNFHRNNAPFSKFRLPVAVYSDQSHSDNNMSDIELQDSNNSNNNNNNAYGSL